MTSNEKLMAAIEKELNRWHGQILNPATQKDDRARTFAAIMGAVKFAVANANDPIAVSKSLRA